MIWLVIWVGCVVAAWAIGNSKSSPVGGLLLGLFLGPIGVLAALALVDNKRVKCPYCREFIDKEATKCPRCQSDLAQSRPPADHVPQAARSVEAPRVDESEPPRGPGAVSLVIGIIIVIVVVLFSMTKTP